MRRVHAWLLGALGVGGLAGGCAVAQTSPMQPDIPQKFTPPMGEWDYVRREAMVPMRDGVKLFTVISSPRARMVRR